MKLFHCKFRWLRIVFWVFYVLIKSQFVGTRTYGSMHNDFQKSLLVVAHASICCHCTCKANRRVIIQLHSSPRNRFTTLCSPLNQNSGILLKSPTVSLLKATRKILAVSSLIKIKPTGSIQADWGGANVFVVHQHCLPIINRDIHISFLAPFLPPLIISNWGCDKRFSFIIRRDLIVFFLPSHSKYVKQNYVIEIGE